MKDHPKLYDKEGNEVTGRPEEGVTYYDANGNELKAPPAGHGRRRVPRPENRRSRSRRCGSAG